MLSSSAALADRDGPPSYEGRVTPLNSAWDVDRHIVLASADKVVLVRFSSYASPPDEVVFHGLKGGSGDDEEMMGEADDLLDQLDDLEGKHKAHKKHSRETQKRRRHGSGADRGRTNAAAVAGQEHYLATQQMDRLLEQLAPKVRKFCTIFTVDTTKVTEFNALYELGHDREPFAVMLFFRNNHIKVDVGTGNTNKINFFAFEGWQDLLPIVDAAYKAGKLGKHIASTDRKYSTVALRR